MYRISQARNFKVALVLVCFLFCSLALYHGYYVSMHRPWLRLPRVDQYYNGLRTLIRNPPLTSDNRRLEMPWHSAHDQYPMPQPYAPYSSLHDLRPCYLDVQNKVKAPSMYAYHGVPLAMPSPALGSYQLFGLQDNVCFDRFARYGPYGLGYDQELGGIGFGNDTENSDNEAIWAETGKIDYTNVNWADAQKRCYESNKHRFVKPANSLANATKSQIPLRTAVVVRCYEGFKWTPLAIINFRAMISELSLKTGSEYDVHLLMQTREIEYPQWLNDSQRQQYIAKYVPRELGGLVTLWSEAQMKLMYPSHYGRPFKSPSNKDMHGVFRSPHLALQIFAKEHAEYDFFWNWELDVRVVGNFYELLSRIGNWAATRSRRLLWEHNERYYIPSYHKSWANFSETLRKNGAGVLNESVFGPVKASWRKPLKLEKRGGSILPDGCLQHADTCGEDEAADLITLNPIFDTRNSGWWFRDDVTGYDGHLQETLPRRASIVTVARLSRRLLLAMDEEVYHLRHNAFAEMFPATIAYHHGFKAVYAPHPVYIDRAWESPSELDGFFNSGERHSTSGRGGPFSPSRERVNKMTSWYFSSPLPAELWRRWLGYRGRNGRGGVEEEKDGKGAGRMCLRSMLLHPVKQEHPSERG